MPKRILDDSLLTSLSLARCSPRAQDAFPRFILLCDDFGCFEVIPRRIVGDGWVYRTDVSEADVVGWLEEYVGAGMAVLWTENERRYCYLTGWDGPHGQRKREEYDPNAAKGTRGAHGSKRKTPRPPPDLVEAVKAGARRDRDGKPPGTDTFPPGNAAEEIPSNSVPAREMAGSARDRGGFAASVPDAVPVPVPREALASRKRAAPEPSGFAIARDRLVAVFAEVTGGKYLWNGAKDAEGLKRVLALGVPLETIVAKWRAGLRGKGWASARTVAQLAAKWNDLEVDREADELIRLRDEAERAIAAGSGPGGAGEPGEAPARPSPAAAAAAAGVALQAAGGIVLGRGG